MQNFLTVLQELYQGSREAYEKIEHCFSNNTDWDNNPVSQATREYLIEEISLVAQKSNPHAMVLLGNIYVNGWGGIAKNVQKAVNYARLAASLGDAGGALLFGFMYANGFGVKQNYQRAVEWFMVALEKGHCMAGNNLGVMYENGLGVKKDINLAIKYYTLSAKQNMPLAISNLERVTKTTFHVANP